MTKPQFNNKLTLPCGSLVGNRFLKSAMSEALASKDHAPGRMLERLYATWSEGGAGILVTGNVMIGSGKTPRPDLPPLKAAFDLLLKTGWQNFVRTRA
jgi:2,4-dienoyl-CoA reductase-like NADH-dependent reductase (Old Yellow Enzyme family)